MIVLVRVRDREPQLVRPRRAHREDVLRYPDHQRRQHLPGTGLEPRDIGVLLVRHEQRLRIRRPDDAVRLLADWKADDLLHRDRVDDRGRVGHPVVHRDELAVGRDRHLMRQASDGDLGHERVRRIGGAVEDPHLIGALRRDEHAQLRVETRIDGGLSRRHRCGHGCRGGGSNIRGRIGLGRRRRNGCACTRGEEHHADRQKRQTPHSTTPLDHGPDRVGVSVCAPESERHSNKPVHAPNGLFSSTKR